MAIYPVFFTLLLGCTIGVAQTLPAHDPVRVLIVSDSVNPHGLPLNQLTKPGDLSAALLATPALNRDIAPDAVIEIPTDQIEAATVLLQRPLSAANAYDTVIYFAHRIPNGSNAQARQEAFVTALQGFLAAGGGLVIFHHGLYFLPGKESMMSLIGAQATGNVSWNTVAGQNVINVSAGHFVANQGVSYPNLIAYSDPANGIAAANHPAFQNLPDERYPQFQWLGSTTGRRLLFASNYVENSSTHVLAFEQRRRAWRGVLVAYQPGEYLPQALGPGNNFQILLNAIVYTAGYAAQTVFVDGFEG